VAGRAPIPRAPGIRKTCKGTDGPRHHQDRYSRRRSHPRLTSAIDLAASGCPPAEQKRAEDLIKHVVDLSVSRRRRRALYRGAGYRSIGDRSRANEHYVNSVVLNDGHILDRMRPESVCVRVSQRRASSGAPVARDVRNSRSAAAFTDRPTSRRAHAVAQYTPPLPHGPNAQAAGGVRTHVRSAAHVLQDRPSSATRDAARRIVPNRADRSPHAKGRCGQVPRVRQPVHHEITRRFP